MFVSHVSIGQLWSKGRKVINELGLGLIEESVFFFFSLPSNLFVSLKCASILHII